MKPGTTRRGVETETVVHYESQHQSNQKVPRRRAISLVQLGYDKAIATGAQGTFKGALQLLINRYGYIRFAQVPERILTKSFVVLMIGSSRVESLRRTGHL